MARSHFSSQALVLIVISIAINMIGGQLASMVKLPIFLDSIGTLISAVLLGPVIGMLTGLLTNLLWGLLTDPIAAAFAPVAMVIGLVAGWLARAGWFRTLPKVVVSGVIITLAVTVVAVPLRTALFGGVTGTYRNTGNCRQERAFRRQCQVSKDRPRTWASHQTTVQ